VELKAPDHWRSVEFISDLHLHATEPGTHAAWVRYLRSTQTDALFILGDLFEVWVGDDVLSDLSGFEAQCARVLRETANRLPIFMMRGNRDFLIGPSFADRSGSTLLEDPVTLHFGSARFVLTHGDELCLEDTKYQAFREMVRSEAWQSAFLSKPLAERQSIARELRQRSEASKSNQTSYADVDAGAAVSVLLAAGARTMVHGHTHRPAIHTLDHGCERWVLSDWHVQGSESRAEALRLSLQDRGQQPVLSRVPIPGF
jgi:UDP-2,3-diacylglucosamine hydrolase